MSRRGRSLAGLPGSCLVLVTLGFLILVSPISSGAEDAEPGTWVLTGRVVRLALSGGAAGLVPFPSVTLHLKLHPRLADRATGSAFHPRKVVTDADGRFELTNVPPELWLRLETDHPEAVHRALVMQLGSVRDSPRRDCGDIFVESGATLRVQLRGPRGEAVKDGTVLVRQGFQRPDLVRGRPKMGESRRTGVEQANGEYVFERTATGRLSVEATAPGYAPGRRQEHGFPADGVLVFRMQRGGSITGEVVDAAGKPIPDAQLTARRRGESDRVEPQRATSDRGGRFELRDLDDGSYDISVEADGFVSDAVPRIALGTRDLKLVLHLEAVVSGRVLALGDDRPVEAATVRLRGPGSSRRTFTAETDAAGRFEIGKLATGRYGLSVYREDFLPFAETLSIELGERVSDLVLRLDAGLRVAGAVTDTDSGSAIPEASIVLDTLDAGASIQRSARTTADGSFDIGGLREGRYRIRVQAVGYQSIDEEGIDISADDDEALAVELLPDDGAVWGRVVDLDGQPIEGATVQSHVRRGFFRGGGSAETDAQGRYELVGLPPSWYGDEPDDKDYFVEAFHPDYAPGWVRVARRPATRRDRIEVEPIRLHPGGMITGRVTDESGDGVSGARVELRAVSREWVNARAPWSSLLTPRPVFDTTTDRDGAFRLRPAPAGDFVLKASLEGRVPRIAKIKIGEGQRLEGVELELSTGRMLTGRVVGPEGEGLPGAEITVTLEKSRYSARTDSVRADGRGHFEVAGIVTEQVEILVKKSGFTSRRLTVPAGGASQVIRLERLARIVGGVRAAGLEIFSELHVAAITDRDSDWVKDHAEDCHAVTRESGEFQITLPAGDYVLWATVRGYAPSPSREIAVSAGELREGVTVDLLTGTIEGTVVLAGSGEPLSDVEVRISSSSTVTRFGTALSARGSWRSEKVLRTSPFRAYPPPAETDANGRFVFEGLPEATLTLEAKHPLFVPPSGCRGSR